MKMDGHVWVAATAAEEGFDRTPTAWAEDRLLSYARTMMPEAATGRILRHTVCFRPATRDDMPVVGQLDVQGRVVVASGGGGTGIMTCLFIGQQVADMVAGGSPEPGFASIGLRRFAQDGGS
jgi:glycine/D-amino acid oxidase-like deaminating enzyme